MLTLTGASSLTDMLSLTEGFVRRPRRSPRGFKPMFDFMAMSKSLPELMKMAPQVSDFMTAWLDFMNRMGRKMEYSESKLETIDNKMTYIARELDKANERLILIMSETSVTPELHGDVLMMANADPRNRPDLNGENENAYVSTG